MIVCCGNVKGGVGKTTLAINFAVALAGRGEDVLLVDGDKQGTAMAFTELRSILKAAMPEPAPAGYTAVALQGGAIRTQVRQLARNYDHIIIDVGGEDSGSLRAALLVSDLLVMPTAPRSFDLWAVERVADLVQEARGFNENLRALAVLNTADPAGRDNGEALAVLAALPGFEVAPCHLGRRKAYPNAAATGLGVLEYSDSSNPDGVAKARAEFRSLFYLLFPTFQSTRKERD
jgi:chromosome partitioning protein